MANDKSDKNDKKSVDLPPYGPRNPDPVTDTPGSHPIETGVGAALGGAATGASLGVVLGPPGVILGAAVGAIAGGYAGKGVGELIDPTTEDNWIREWLAGRSPLDGVSDEAATKAYRFGLRHELEHAGKTFDEAEPALRAEWDRTRDPADPAWGEVSRYARNGFDKVREFNVRPQ